MSQHGILTGLKRFELLSSVLETDMLPLHQRPIPPQTGFEPVNPLRPTVFETVAPPLSDYGIKKTAMILDIVAVP